MAAKRYEISDEQWEQIKDMFPRASTDRSPKDNRLIFNAILWLVRSGAAWARYTRTIRFASNSIQPFLQMER